MEAINSGGWSLVGIGQGELKAFRSWARLLKVPATIRLYSDMTQPSLPAFAHLGANFRGERIGCGKLTVRTIKGTIFALRMLARSRSLDLTAGLAKNNVFVNAGIVALDQDGTHVFRHMQSDVLSPLPSASLASALKAV